MLRSGVRDVNAVKLSNVFFAGWSPPVTPVTSGRRIRGRNARLSAETRTQGGLGGRPSASSGQRRLAGV